MNNPDSTSRQKKKPHLSYSGISMFTKCPMQFKFRYVDGLKRAPAGVQMTIGSAVHKGAEVTFKHKMKFNELLTPEDQNDATRDALIDAWDGDEEKDIDPVELTAEEKAIGKAKTKDKAIDIAVALSDLHAKELAPTIMPYTVEEKFRLEIDGAKYDLLGYLDVTERHDLGDGEVLKLRDLKTKGKSPSKGEADETLQFSIYALAMFTMHGKLPDAIVMDCLVKTKTPKLVQQHTTRTKPQMIQLLQRIRITLEAIETGVFPPTDPTNWWCGDKWCGYWSDCPFGGGTPLPTRG